MIGTCLVMRLALQGCYQADTFLERKELLRYGLVNVVQRNMVCNYLCFVIVFACIWRTDGVISSALAHAHARMCVCMHMWICMDYSLENAQP